MQQNGVAAQSPMTLLSEYLASLRALLAGGRVTADGRYVHLEDVALEWPPTAAPAILVGAIGPRTLRLSGEAADGTVLVAGIGPDEVRHARALIAEGQAAAGRGDAHRVVVHLAVAGRDAARAAADVRGLAEAARIRSFSSRRPSRPTSITSSASSASPRSRSARCCSGTSIGRTACPSPGRPWLAGSVCGMASIFVTGSSDGIGRETARQLVEGGHRVVLHARDDARAEDAAAALPGASGVAVGDLSVVAGIRQAAESASALGPYDAVIHNAGVGAPPRGTGRPKGASGPSRSTCWDLTCSRR